MYVYLVHQTQVEAVVMCTSRSLVTNIVDCIPQPHRESVYVSPLSRFACSLVINVLSINTLSMSPLCLDSAKVTSIPFSSSTCGKICKAQK